MTEKTVNPELLEVTDEIRKAIIEQYYKHPVLWHKDKLDRSAAAAAWEFISSAVSTRTKSFSIEVVKKAMKNLKDQFVRCHKKAQQEGADTVHWKFYEPLLFLGDHIQTQKQPLKSTENSRPDPPPPKSKPVQPEPVASTQGGYLSNQGGYLSNFVSSISSAFTSGNIKEELELSMDESVTNTSVTNQLFEATQQAIEMKESPKEKENFNKDFGSQNETYNTFQIENSYHDLTPSRNKASYHDSLGHLYREVPGVSCQMTPIRDDVKPEEFSQNNTPMNIGSAPGLSISATHTGPVLSYGYHTPGLVNGLPTPAFLPPLSECVSQAICPTTYDDKEYQPNTPITYPITSSPSLASKRPSEAADEFSTPKQQRIEGLDKEHGTSLANNQNSADNHNMKQNSNQNMANKQSFGIGNILTNGNSLGEKNMPTSHNSGGSNSLGQEVRTNNDTNGLSKPSEVPKTETPEKPTRKPTVARKKTTPRVKITPKISFADKVLKESPEQEIDRSFKSESPRDPQSGLGLMVTELTRKLEQNNKKKEYLEFKRGVINLIDQYETIIYE
ncbi:unnamed protein product [Bursaphelenchus okinawaensis]|uniref:MADF domain-containing protein n=1 Tax=Bursaphelenchus okinawaensis TaxID=465554 RepID=A0A811L6V7_9BILA|nr:unnamed protein product [Bursaphelenchus okinawaensis]CAG9117871.1 unnamed protein product [Bursaphelenchus okinawaensis]